MYLVYIFEIICTFFVFKCFANSPIFDITNFRNITACNKSSFLSFLNGLARLNHNCIPANMFYISVYYQITYQLTHIFKQLASICYTLILLTNAF
jgi:hypothetical protein